VVGIRQAPDGKVPEAAAASARIAFARTRGARWESPDIYLASADGSNVRRLTFGTSPDWSPDGTRLAFLRDESGWDPGGIYITNIDGSGERYLGRGYSPAWSSGGELAYSFGGGNILVTNPDATGPLRLRFLLPQGWALSVGEPCQDGWLSPHVDHPAWSADGRQIAFVLTCHSEWSRVFVVEADGTLAEPLLEFGGGWPAWSPVGSRLAMIGDSGITIVDFESELEEVHEADGISLGNRKIDWSPDGRQIAFSGGSPEKERLFVLDLESGSVHELLPGSPDYYADFDVSWSRESGS